MFNWVVPTSPSLPFDFFARRLVGITFDPGTSREIFADPLKMISNRVDRCESTPVGDEFRCLWPTSSTALIQDAFINQMRTNVGQSLSYHNTKYEL